MTRGIASNGHAGRPLLDEECCKTLFGSLKTNFPGCGRGDRIIVRGTTATSDELTGNFGSALEGTSIGDCRLTALFAEKLLQANFGACQHYTLNNGHSPNGRLRQLCAKTGSQRPFKNIQSSLHATLGDARRSIG